MSHLSGCNPHSQIFTCTYTQSSNGDGCLLLAIEQALEYALAEHMKATTAELERNRKGKNKKNIGSVNYYYISAVNHNTFPYVTKI